MNTNLNEHSEEMTVSTNIPVGNVTYQEAIQSATIQSIKEAIIDMRKTGAKMNRTNLAKESGVLRQLLYLKLYNELLNTYPECNKALELERRIIQMPAQEAVDATMQDNEALRKELAAAKDEIKRLRVNLKRADVRKKEYDNAVMHAMGDHARAHLEPDKNPFVEHETEV